MPLADDDVKKLARFKNLRKLILNATPITGKSIAYLQPLKKLSTLSLSGTKIKAEELTGLTKLPKLVSVYVWDIPSDANALAAAKKKLTGIQLETGFSGDTIRIRLSPPLIDNEAQVIHKDTRIKLRHPVPGVVIRYTIDGSDPDSTSSPVYADNLVIKTTTRLKAAAFKPGWYASPVLEKQFFRAGFMPDSVELLTPASHKYPANGKKTLTDGIKSDANVRSGKWLSYTENDLQALFHFKNPVKIQSLTASYLLSVNAYIFPPTRIEIWGGMQKNKLRKLGQTTEPMPTALTPAEPANKALEVRFAPQELLYLKLIIHPHQKLPSWHRGAGSKGWIFVDEVFIN